MVWVGGWVGGWVDGWQEGIKCEIINATCQLHLYMFYINKKKWVWEVMWDNKCCPDGKNVIPRPILFWSQQCSHEVTLDVLPIIQDSIYIMFWYLHTLYDLPIASCCVVSWWLCVNEKIDKSWGEGMTGLTPVFCKRAIIYCRLNIRCNK